MTDMMLAPSGDLDCLRELTVVCTLVAFATCSGRILGPMCFVFVLSRTCSAQPVP